MDYSKSQRIIRKMTSALAYTTLTLAVLSGSYAAYNTYKLFPQIFQTKALRTEPIYIATEQSISENRDMLESLSKLESELLTQAQTSTVADVPLKFVQEKKAKSREVILSAQSTPLYQMAVSAINESAQKESNYSNNFLYGSMILLPSTLAAGLLFAAAKKMKDAEPSSVH